MGKRKMRKHFKKIYTLKTPPLKEYLYTQTGSVPLNIAQTDRISFSVLRNTKKRIRKIENISYEININDKWEWIVRYDDHGGSGSLHRHFRVSLTDDREVESDAGIKRYSNKDFELTWVCNDIKKHYMLFRSKFLKNIGNELTLLI
ncbi:MAG: hypothetical protein HY429_02220 [Candidatus Levybacteria bacterium]|nr:hypothetical protein [Candidatus Levybacteria bacterium]